MVNRSSIVAGAVGLALLILANSIYIVQESERAIKLRFGRIIQPDVQPGLAFKLPFVDEVRRFDARVLALDLREQEYITVDKKVLEVDSYVMWRIKDVERFFTDARGSVSVAQNLVSPLVSDGLMNKFGERNQVELIRGDREALMAQLTKELTQVTEDEYGLELIDIRVKKIEQPADVQEAVYGNMREERFKIAQSYRSEGEEMALGIRADADRRVRAIAADAYRKAEITRGEGDALAASIYAKAFNQDPAFYEFTRSLNAYRQTFDQQGDVLVIGPDSKFFKYLDEIKP